MNRAEPEPFTVTIHLPDVEPGKSPAFLKVAGVMVLTRLILGAMQAGAGEISVAGSYADTARSRCGDDPRLKGRGIRWETSQTRIEKTDIHVDANVVVGNSVWQLLSECEHAAFVPAAPRMERTGSSEPEPLWHPDPPTGAYVVPMIEQHDITAAKDAIFANVTKSTSGPISRNLNSRISIPISRVLCEFGVTPNQMTLVATIVGFISAWFVARGRLTDVAIGGTLFQLCAALDRVDGELARSTFRASPLGAWIDTVGDNLVYVVFAVCLIIGYERYTLAHEYAIAGWVLPLGISMVLVMLVLVGGMTWYLVDTRQPGTMTAVHQDLGQKMGEARTNWLFKTLDSLKILGKRDSFSFVVFLLSITPMITGTPFGYHLLFWISMAGILFISIHFAMAMAISRKHVSTVVKHER